MDLAHKVDSAGEHDSTTTKHMPETELTRLRRQQGCVHFPLTKREPACGQVGAAIAGGVDRSCLARISVFASCRFVAFCEANSAVVRRSGFRLTGRRLGGLSVSSESQFSLFEIGSRGVRFLGRALDVGSCGYGVRCRDFLELLWMTAPQILRTNTAALVPKVVHFGRHRT